MSPHSAFSQTATEEVPPYPSLLELPTSPPASQGPGGLLGPAEALLGPGRSSQVGCVVLSRAACRGLFSKMTQRLCLLHWGSPVPGPRQVRESVTGCDISQNEGSSLLHGLW